MAVTSCAEIRELFSARADGALRSDERAQLDAHLATCAECAREWRRFEQTLALVRSIEPARAPAGLVDRVMAARPRPWYRRLARTLLVPWPVKLPLEAAAILVVAGLAVLLVQRSPELLRAAREPATPPPSVTSETPVATRGPGAAPAPVVMPPAVATAPPAPSSPADSSAARSEPRAAPPPPIPSSAPESSAAPGAPREQELRQRNTLSADSQRRGDMRDAAPTKAAPARTPDAASNAAPSPPAVAAPSDAASSSSAAPSPPPAPGAAASGTVAQTRALERAKTDTLAKERSDPQPFSSQTAVANPPGIVARLTTPDREAGVRAVREIVARVNGQIVVRGENDDGALIELSVPRPRWEEVKTQLQALGPLQLETVGDAGADPLRILLRLQR